QCVKNWTFVRYIFINTNETFQLRIGANDSRLEEIKRSGSEKITLLNEPVRGTTIAYEDLALKFLYWPNARVVGADFIRTRNCWRMQLQAPASDSNTARFCSGLIRTAALSCGWKVMIPREK